MSDLRKAAQMVLETWDADDWFDAGTLRAAIAQPEPAAFEDIPACMFCGELIEPAAPREPLTDEDIKELAHQHRETLWPRKDRSDVQTTAIPFARAVIAALGGPRNE
jgi:hypothetical protein